MYDVVYHELVEDDLKRLGNNVLVKVLKKIQQIAANPNLGKELGNRANLNLSGYRKVYVENKKIRIVYKIIDHKLEIFVVTVGKRDDMSVYKDANDRIN
ncbi:MAG: type II toxin-antitoxin system RelE/ParE family toxin [Epsilonproteobacteria bacterium]|nr:type II toxin-antitoxin system RelE/ParE family toxin [Campylobacterota bacterium]